MRTKALVILVAALVFMAIVSINDLSILLLHAN